MSEISTQITLTTQSDTVKGISEREKTRVQMHINGASYAIVELLFETDTAVSWDFIQTRLQELPSIKLEEVKNIFDNQIEIPRFFRGIRFFFSVLDGVYCIHWEEGSRWVSRPCDKGEWFNEKDVTLQKINF